MGEQSEALKQRAMRFALDILDLIRQLPAHEPGPTFRRQLAKSATSVAINYRATCRARSRREFASRLAIVAEESDEALGWLELARAAHLLAIPDLRRLIQEAGELTAIFSSSAATARRNARNSPPL